MKQLIRRIVLSVATLSPGVIAITVQELALSVVIMLIGITGAMSVALAAFAVSPKVNQSLTAYSQPNSDYPSLLVQSAFTALVSQSPNPHVIRANMDALMAPAKASMGFVRQDEQVAMILAQILARWGKTSALDLSDAQARELWLIERLLRATPAQAGAMAENFTAPNAMLAMRDRIAAISSV